MKAERLVIDERRSLKQRLHDDSIISFIPRAVINTGGKLRPTRVTLLTTHPLHIRVAGGHWRRSKQKVWTMVPQL